MISEAQQAGLHPIFLATIAVVLGFVANSLLEWLKSSLEGAREVKRVRRALYLDVCRLQRLLLGINLSTPQATGTNFRVIFTAEEIDTKPLELGLHILTDEEVKTISEFYMKFGVMSHYVRQYGQSVRPEARVGVFILPSEAHDNIAKWLPDLKEEASNSRELLENKF